MLRNFAINRINKNQSVSEVIEELFKVLVLLVKYKLVRDTLLVIVFTLEVWWSLNWWSLDVGRVAAVALLQSLDFGNHFLCKLKLRHEVLEADLENATERLPAMIKVKLVIVCLHLCHYWLNRFRHGDKITMETVSYTHLTLPTRDLV